MLTCRDSVMMKLELAWVEQNIEKQIYYSQTDCFVKTDDRKITTEQIN